MIKCNGETVSHLDVRIKRHPYHISNAETIITFCGKSNRTRVHTWCTNTFQVFWIWLPISMLITFYFYINSACIKPVALKSFHKRNSWKHLIHQWMQWKYMWTEKLREVNSKTLSTWKSDTVSTKTIWTCLNPNCTHHFQPIFKETMLSPTKIQGKPLSIKCS